MPSQPCDARSPSRLPATTALLLAMLPLGTGCFLVPESCTAEFVYGLHVAVRDSLTSAPAAPGAVVIAQERAWFDTLDSFGDSLYFIGAGERAGRYTVTVSKPGYRVWTRSGVLVEEEGCHVETVSIEALLQLQSP